MKLSETINKTPRKIKTVSVKYIRTLLDGTKVYNTLTGKKIYLLWPDGRWTTCNGITPLNYNFQILE